MRLPLKPQGSSSKMTKLKVTFFIFLLIGIASQCTDQKKNAECAAPETDVNPNKSSELAMLMREMADYTEQIKPAVNNGSYAGSLPTQFRAIKTAIPTDDQIKGASFDEYADAFLIHLESLHSEKINQKENYNALVGSCISCHEASCPGPIRRIEKMKI